MRNSIRLLWLLAVFLAGCSTIKSVVSGPSTPSVTSKPTDPPRQITVTWQPATQYVDGSRLPTPAYRIWNMDNPATPVQIFQQATTTYSIKKTGTPGRSCFGVTVVVFNPSESQSAMSNVVCKTI